MGSIPARRRQSAFRWRLLALIYVSSLLYMLFQGGKTAVMIFCILNGLIVYISLGYWSGIRGISGKRLIRASGDLSPAAQAVLSAGSSQEVSLSMKMPGYYPVPYVLVRERLQRNGSEEIPFEISFVPNVKRSGQASYRTPPLERGVYRFLPTECSTRDLFGFFEHTGHFESADAFAVRPRTIELRGWERVRRGAKGHYSHASAPRASRETTQINGIREFLPGDRLSRVHWGATAKTGQWKSKEFEREALPRTIVLLDACRRQAPGAEARFEVAVSTAASLFQHGLRRNTSMGLWISSRIPGILRSGSGGDQLHRAMDLLTAADNDGAEGIDAALPEAEAVLERGSLAVLVTDAGADEVRRAMSRLSRRGMNPCCIKIEDRSSGTDSPSFHDYGGPVYVISSLEELPDALDGREVANDA
ncbi:DUF58 domain-containing protein [Paenibacillus humicus]|uniref:DUF58 domain-containing protein n=1 Tax=Paenibacillus humicus TaxID=412861 RepID=UPI000FD9DA05|nr:DUF58 domain-containing protein [Paenibacillus humicus]